MKDTKSLAQGGYAKLCNVVSPQVVNYQSDDMFVDIETQIVVFFHTYECMM